MSIVYIKKVTWRGYKKPVTIARIEAINKHIYMTQKEEKMNFAIGMSSLALIVAVVALIATFAGPKRAVAPETPEAFFAETARELGVRSKTFEQCFAGDEAQARVKEDEDEVLALTNGIVGTPYSILVTPDGTLIPVSGALPYELFEMVISLAKEQSYEKIQELYNQVYAGSGDVPDISALKGKTLRAFDTETDHYQGNPESPMALIEFSDYQCPYCAQVHETMHKIADSDLGVVWVYRNLPLSSIHPGARPAAIAAECIAEHAGNDAFWSFTDTIFGDQTVLQ